MTNHYDEMRVAPDAAQAEELRQRLHARMAGIAGRDHADERVVPTISLSDATTTRNPIGRRRLVIAAAAVIVVIGAVGLVVSDRHSRKVGPSPAVTVAPDPAPTATSAPATVPATAAAQVLNGWAAFAGESSDGTSDIYLLRDGDAAHRLIMEGSDTGSERCPAFSPDGKRLMFSSTHANSDDQLVIVTVADDGSVMPVTTVPLDGGVGQTCATWASDGRWIAFADAGGVSVADTTTAEIRHLVSYRPSDLEWRPGTNELAVAGEVHGEASIGGWSNGPLVVYTASTGEARRLGHDEVRDIAWSPDGATLAYTRYAWNGVAGDERTSGITLIDADGSNVRPLTTTDHRAYLPKEVTIQWSPRGDLIAYARPCSSCSDQAEIETVLVTATDDDPAMPIGTEITLATPVTETASGSMVWYPYSFSWAPDGTRLLYESFTLPDRHGGVVIVPIDSDQPPQQLFDDPGVNLRSDTDPVEPTQQWGRE